MSEAMVGRDSAWQVPMRMANLPPVVKRRVAMGSMASKRSTARRVTTSAGATPGPGVAGWTRVSARAVITFTSVNVSERITSRRKAAFLWFDSIRVSEMAGDQIFSGRPGKPAPEPMSITRTSPLSAMDVEGRGDRSWSCTRESPPFENHEGWGTLEVMEEGNRWRAKKKDSPKWRVTICCGSRTAVRLMRAFQRSNRSMYIDIFARCTSAGAFSRKGCSRPAISSDFSVRSPLSGTTQHLYHRGTGEHTGRQNRKSKVRSQIAEVGAIFLSLR